MESVIATVSGYSGAERFNLIKLIDHSGASYVGAMSSSITHLVCRKFEGKKYDIAIRSGTVVLNHRWIEDCVKLGRRVPEDPYTLQSGEEVGPLSLEVPAKNQKALSDKTNACVGGSKKRSGSIGFETSRDVFDENWITGAKRHVSSLKSKCKVFGGTTNKELRSNSGISFQALPLHGSRTARPVESTSHSSMDMERDKRKNFSDNGDIMAESSRKGKRRLVKKYKKREMVELLTSDSDQECSPSRIHTLSDDTVALSDQLYGETHHNASKNGGHEILRTDAQNCAYSLIDSNDLAENEVTITKMISEDRFSGAADDLKEETIEDLKIMNDSNNPSPELSCVICWTDFSSSRGVLQCGHRFCYSCIENWADHMASRRRISTCPLCKTTFLKILKFEDPASDDQKIYSQTIPCGLMKMDTFILPDQEMSSLNSQVEQPESRPVCGVCCHLEPEDFLIACNLCRIQRIHSYCLDPPVDPWTCSDCTELQRLYLINR